MNNRRGTAISTIETKRRRSDDLEEALARTPPRADDAALTRAQLIKRRWWLIVLIAIIAGAATYGISQAVPANYNSSATVSVQLTGNDPNQAALGANSVASQYAQVVNAQAVVAQASRQLSPRDASGLTGAVTGGTVADQNIVQIRADGKSAGQAQRRAAAVVTAFTAYVANRVTAQSDAYSVAARRQLQPIQDEIASVSREISSTSSAGRNSGHFVALQQTLSTLIAQRTAAIATVAETATGGQPSVSVVDLPGSGTKVSPKPTLYAGVGFLIALFLASQLVIHLGPRRAGEG